MSETKKSDWIPEGMTKETEYFRMAMGLAEIPVDYWTAELIISVQKETERLEDKFSVKDAVRVRAEVENRRLGVAAQHDARMKQEEEDSMQRAMQRRHDLEKKYEGHEKDTTGQ